MKGKKIDPKDIVNSPYFIAVLLVLVIMAILAAIVFFSMDIDNIKDEVVETRKQYQENLREMAILEELRAQSEKAEAQLEVYKGILPDDLGDIYILEEEVLAGVRNFGLDVSACVPSQVADRTYETIFTISCSGKYTNIHSYLAYVSTLEQIHRVDSLVLTKASGDTYAATFSIVILSQMGADGLTESLEGAA